MFICKIVRLCRFTLYSVYFEIMLQRRWNAPFSTIFQLYSNGLFYSWSYILEDNNLYIGTCLIWHTKGSGKCVGLYRIPECSVFILFNRNTLEPWIFDVCDRMSENSGVGLHKFHCIYNKYTVYIYIFVYARFYTC